MSDEVAEADDDALMAELRSQILVMKCWLCKAPIGEKSEDDDPDHYFTKPYEFPLCEKCAGAELFPRAHVWNVMEGLRATQRFTRRKRTGQAAEIARLTVLVGELREIEKAAKELTEAWMDDDGDVEREDRTWQALFTALAGPEVIPRLLADEETPK